MTEIKLKQNAPWKDFTLSDGFKVSKIYWIVDDGTHILQPVESWLERRNATPSEPICPNIESVEESLLRLDSYKLMTRKELQDYCKTNNITFELTDKKADLLEKVLAVENPF